MKRKGHQAGFTIIELVISVAVVAIVALLSYVAYNGVQNNARKVTVLSDLDNASSILEHDLQKTGSYPATVEDADNGKGLVASDGSTFQYVANNTGSTKRFCLSVTNGTETYNTTQEGKVSIGLCPFIHYDSAEATSYTGTGTSVTDLGTGAFNGTMINGPTVGTKGWVFDGVDDKVVSDAVPTLANNTTWSAWVYCTQNISTINMFMGRYLPYVGFYAGNSFYFSNRLGGTQRAIRSTPTNLQLNTWYHGVFVNEYDGTGTTMKIYINGAKNVSATYAGSQDHYAQKFTLGDGYGTTWYPFKGEVSDPRVYSYAMSDDEIKRLFEEQRSRYGV